MVVETSVSDITALITQITAVTIPAIIGLVMGIINFVNHKTNSSKIHDITDKVGAALGKADEVSKQIASHEDQIKQGLIVAGDLSPDAKALLIKADPTVIALQAKTQEMQKKIDELSGYLNTITSATGGSVANANPAPKAIGGSTTSATGL